MPDHNVKVWGKSHTVTTYQKTKSVWIVVGEYMGETIQTQDRTEGAAVKRWKERAHSKGG